MMNFIVVGALGLMLLLLVPDSKVRWQRLATKGGAAMLVGLGLFGAVYSALAA